MAIRADAHDFERALDAGRTAGAADPALHPAAYRMRIEGNLELWNSFGPRILAGKQIGPPEPSYPVTYPALTAAQRLHFESFGYVVVEDAIPRELADRLTVEIHELQAEANGGCFPDGKGASLYSNRNDYFRVTQPHYISGAALEFITHPRILGMAREVTGGARIRYMESDCQIRRPNPTEAGTRMISADGLHRGIRAPWCCWHLAKGKG